MTITVIGGGSFGTALAAVYARAGQDVLIWMRNSEVAKEINETHYHTTRLPGITLPENLVATTDLRALENAQQILMVLPAQQTRPWLQQNASALPEVPVICCAKGIDRETGLTQTEIIKELAPNHDVGVISGPGFADEIAKGLPTAMALATDDPVLTNTLQKTLSTKTLRLYASTDPLGVQFGGALKNVIAIGCGVAIGSGLGQSARAALLTRGFSEMVRLGLALGGQMESFGGLAGLGDLTLTATSETSRNYALGLAIGADKAPKANTTTEGAYTARIALKLAKDHQLDLPVIETTARLLEGEISHKAAVEYFFSRPLGKEF